MLILKVINNQTNEAQEKTFTPEIMAQGGSLIGRHPKCDLVLTGVDVSRVHARIIYQAGQYSYSDLGSTGGSTVNEEKAQTNQSFLLKPNDLIRIGEFMLLVKAVEANDVFSEDDASGVFLAQPSILRQYAVPALLAAMLLVVVMSTMVHSSLLPNQIALEQLLHKSTEFLSGLMHSQLTTAT